MADSAIERISGARLEADLESHETLLVAFVAEWCEPCQTLVPRLERLAARHEGRFRCYLVDVDREPDLAQKYGVRGMPTLELFEDGDLEATRVGALDDDQLEQFVTATLDK
ncbi:MULTISPECIES: thioredoxin family protein [Modicisalibacter]|uniref:thioredoxin family protein n=1 Tax=Modicisalibacter TaxID=574347 RepID=UPI00139678C1|nr:MULTISPECIES: thioredoxin family protein [Halomonadaceae]MBZ9558115.1 thioredoxin family protein [Modicisalibacter sp. R2A 31.J]MBZ9573216.1 thioredoxin family protein [Modicisalibacter sp. MOD 31.J]